MVEQGHEIIACVRDASRFEIPPSCKNHVSVHIVDFLETPDLENFPKYFDVAYYLIHSMSHTIGNFSDKESKAAEHFKTYLDHSTAQQIIYLTGIAEEDTKLSAHLSSRLNVENILHQCTVPLTALRAGIIVGSGSASFEIIRDLVEKLPVMVMPKWVKTQCQPVAIRNVIQYLTGVLLRQDCYSKSFDIGCGEVLTYKQMLQQYAAVRQLNRLFITVPIMTPRLSSYWLYFVTSTSYPLAVNLVDSMKIDVICRENQLAQLLDIDLIPYKKAVEMAFSKIRQNMVVSSWKDSFVSSLDKNTLADNIEVPEYGCFKDYKERIIEVEDTTRILRNIWSIGGERGWYYGSFLWKIRGFLDKLIGGVGLRRGRTNPHTIDTGDALDFWRVLVADEQQKRLLLYAEMKLPGDAWLEFKITTRNNETVVQQTATFRPSGILGRLYWYGVFPFHLFVFDGMINNLVNYGRE